MIDNLINLTTEDFFIRLKSTNEDFGIFKVKKTNLDYHEFDFFKNYVINFLTYGIYDDPYIKINDPKEYNTKKVINWTRNIENYCKYVWLTHEYLNHNKFNNYMGIHWDPLIDKWKIHPGGSRKLVHYFFGPEKSKFIGFNTNNKGKKFILQKKYTSIKEFEMDFTGYSISFTADHNTIVPHVHFENHNYIVNHVIQYHKKIKNFYLNTNIIANFNIDNWAITNSSSKKNTVKVVLEEVNNENILKAFMLLPNFKNFNNYGVKIEST